MSFFRSSTSWLLGKDCYIQIYFLPIQISSSLVVNLNASYESLDFWSQSQQKFREMNLHEQIIRYCNLHDFVRTDVCSEYKHTAFCISMPNSRVM